MNAFVLVQWLLLAAILPVVFGILRSRRQGRVQQAFSVIFIYGYIWALGQHLVNSVQLYLPNERLFRASLYICYLGMCALGPCCVYLAWCYAGRYHLYRNTRWVLALFGTGAFFYLAVLTTDVHGLYYTSFSLAGRFYGPLFYIFTTFSYLCFFYTYFTMQRTRLGMGEPSSPLLLLCFAPPVAANTVGMMIDDLTRDFTPAAYCVMVLASVLLLWRQRPVVLAPIAAQQVFDQIEAPVRVTAADGTTLYRNSAVEHESRIYQPHETMLWDGSTLHILTDVTDYERARIGLNVQVAALERVRLQLEEQSRQLAQQSAIEEKLGADRERVKLAAALDAEVRDQLEALFEKILELCADPQQEGIAECRQLARRTLTTVRSLVGSVQRRPGDEL